MSPKSPPDAWVSMPSEAEVRAVLPPDSDRPYDFGFLPAMFRLTDHVRARRAHAARARDGGGGRGGSPGLPLLNAVARRVSACRGRQPRAGPSHQNQAM